MTFLICRAADKLVQIWLFAGNHTKSCPVSCQSPLSPNMITELVPHGCSRPHHYSLSERAKASFFASSLPSVQNTPWTPPLSFIYHIFCPAETFQSGRESRQPVTRRGQWPHRKLLIPPGMSSALEYCPTRWTQCWFSSTKAQLKINPCVATAENFIM